MFHISLKIIKLISPFDISIYILFYINYNNTSTQADFNKIKTLDPQRSSCLQTNLTYA